MTWWMIYLWTRLDSILLVSVLGTVIFGGLVAMCSIGYVVERTTYTEETDEAKLCKCAIRIGMPIFIVFLMLSIFVPSKKDAAMIYVIPKMAHSETFNTLSKETPEITKLALDALKETLQGMTKKEVK